MNRGIDTNHCSGGKTCSNCCFCMIPNESAKECQSGLNSITAQKHINFPICILQIRSRGQGTEIHPFATIGMAHKALMLLIGISMKNALLDFPTDFAMWSNNRTGIDLSTCFDDASISDMTWSLDK